VRSKIGLQGGPFCYPDFHVSISIAGKFKEERMRVLAAWILILGLAASPVLAGTGGAADGKDSAAAKANDNSAAKETPESSSAAAAKAGAPGTPATPASPSMENQLQQLRDLLEAQSRQLQTQNEQLKEQQRKMQAMEEQMKNVSASSSSSNLVNEGAIGSLGSNPAIGGVKVTNLPDQDKKPDGEPTSIHVKGITLTPGGFLAAEGVWRSHALSNDVNTDYKAIPMPGSSQAKVSELNFSGRQSQINLLAQGKLDNVTLRGYVEGDFLSAGTTSNNNQTNSYTYRQRQAWAQAALESGWTFTGGQMWSLVTETTKLLAPLSEARPKTIDANYNAGFSWARQFGFRVSKNFGSKFAVGFSVENPQTTFGGKIQTQNTLIAAPGDLGGLFNNQANYSFNASPDFVVKMAFEPGWGHYEIFGLVSSFRTRVFPCAGASALLPCPVDGSTTPSALGASNDIKTGGGIGANARAPFFNKHLEIGLHFLGGDGVGRYGAASLADVTAKPDGSLSLLHSYQGLGSIELHFSKLDIYGYGGGEYDSRASFGNVGYGAIGVPNSGCRTEIKPTNQNTPGPLAACQADTRSLFEGTLGFWYRFYNGPKGRLQYGFQYSYLPRNTWSATAGGDPHGVENMALASFRYYLP
jgi:hypothetical protein